MLCYARIMPLFWSLFSMAIWAEIIELPVLMGLIEEMHPYVARSIDQQLCLTFSVNLNIFKKTWILISSASLRPFLNVLCHQPSYTLLFPYLSWNILLFASILSSTINVEMVLLAISVFSPCHWWPGCISTGNDRSILVVQWPIFGASPPRKKQFR